MTQPYQIITVGHACWDNIMLLPHLPKRNHKTIAASNYSTAGGSAARTALALSQRAQVRMISVLGNAQDILTQQLLCELQANHIDTALVEFDDHSSSYSSIWVTPDSSRTIASVHAADRAKNFDFELTADAALFDNNKPLLNASVKQQLNSSCIKLMDVDTTVVNIQSLQGYDHVWFSAETFSQLGMSLSSLNQLLNCVVGVTDGANPVLWHDQEGYHTVKPPVISVDNSVGAGDIWRAELALALLSQLDATEAVAAACEATAKLIGAAATTS